MSKPKPKKREATPKAPKVSPASVDAPPAPKKPPQVKRAEKAAERQGWTQEAIDEATRANGGIPKDANPSKSGPGQPSKYPTIDLERVEMYAAGGLTKKEIAEKVGIGLSTAMDYQTRYPEFLEAIERGRKRETDKVESALHRNAMGYTHPEEKVFYDSQVGQVVTHQTFRHYPGDTKAQLAILQHAETGSWKPKTDINHSGQMAVTHNYDIPNKRPVGT